eukprot:jgi/Mesen1/1552/ME000134S00666
MSSTCKNMKVIPEVPVQWNSSEVYKKLVSTKRRGKEGWRTLLERGYGPVNFQKHSANASYCMIHPKKMLPQVMALYKSSRQKVKAVTKEKGVTDRRTAPRGFNKLLDRLDVMGIKLPEDWEEILDSSGPEVFNPESEEVQAVKEKAEQSRKSERECTHLVNEAPAAAAPQRASRKPAQRSAVAHAVPAAAAASKEAEKRACRSYHETQICASLARIARSYAEDEADTDSDSEGGDEERAYAVGADFIGGRGQGNGKWEKQILLGEDGLQDGKPRRAHMPSCSPSNDGSGEYGRPEGVSVEALIEDMPPSAMQGLEGIEEILEDLDRHFITNLTSPNHQECL